MHCPFCGATASRVVDTTQDPEHDEIRRLKLERLREELAKGEADLAAGRSAVLEDDQAIEAFFARL